MSESERGRERERERKRERERERERDWRCVGGLGAGSEENKVLEYGPGGAFGELALLHGEPRLATVRAVGPCEWVQRRSPQFLEGWGKRRAGGGGEGEGGWREEERERVGEP